MLILRKPSLQSVRWQKVAELQHTLFVVSVLAPASSNSLTIKMWPFSTAWNNAVFLSWVEIKVISDFISYRWYQRGRFQVKHADKDSYLYNSFTIFSWIFVGHGKVYHNFMSDLTSTKQMTNSFVSTVTTFKLVSRQSYVQSQLVFYDLEKETR